MPPSAGLREQKEESEENTETSMTWLYTKEITAMQKHDGFKFIFSKLSSHSVIHNWMPNDT